MNQNKNTDKNEDANNQVEDENTTSVNNVDTQPHFKFLRNWLKTINLL